MKHNSTNTFSYNATSSDIFVQIRQAGTYYLDNIRMYRVVEETVVVEGVKRGVAYRYGFNGMERDDNVKGAGNSYDFGARMYDPRVGRWLSGDPLEAKYPMYSPYNFVRNSPLLFVDPDGRDIIIHFKDRNGNNQYYKYGSEMTIPNDDFVKQSVKALDYLKTTEVGSGIVSRLETDKYKVVTLTNFIDNRKVQDASDFEYIPSLTDKKGKILKEGDIVSSKDIRINIGEISWDPYQSIQFNDGTLISIDENDNSVRSNASISPATALGHELAHAYLSFYSTIRFIQGHVIEDEQYNNRNEKDAIKLIENKVAKELGEGIRISHEGDSIQVSSPTSNKPIIETSNSNKDAVNEK